MTRRQAYGWVRRQHPAYVGMAAGAAPVLLGLAVGLGQAVYETVFVPQDPTLIGPFTSFAVLGMYATVFLLPLTAGIGAGIAVLACFVLRRTGRWQGPEDSPRVPPPAHL